MDSITNVFGQEIKVGDPILYFGACTADARVGRLAAVRVEKYCTGSEYRYPIVESAGERSTYVYDRVSGSGHYERGGWVRWRRQLSAANVFPLTKDMVFDTGENEHPGYISRQNTAKVAKFLKLFD